MARRRRRRSSRSGSCRAGEVVIKKKSGRVVARFKGHHGPGCPRRRFRTGVTPAHLRPYAAAAKACARQGKKPGTKAMGSCITSKAG